MRNYKSILYILIMLFISASCIDSGDNSTLPPPPEKPPKFIVNHNGIEYKFETEMERNKFFDSLGVSIDSMKKIQ